MESGEAKRSNTKLFLVIGLVLMGVGALGIGIGVVLAKRNAPSAVIPSSIAEQVLFPVYTSKPLPKGYMVVENSFKVQEKAIVFRAMNGEGTTITISEQAKPDKFDFTAFYQQQMSHTKNLQGVPFPSVLGTVQGNTVLLSIVTSKTWLLVSSTTAPEADLRFIAQHIKQQ